MVTFDSVALVSCRLSMVTNVLFLTVNLVAKSATIASIRPTCYHLLHISQCKLLYNNANLLRVVVVVRGVLVCLFHVRVVLHNNRRSIAYCLPLHCVHGIRQ